ncbi:hypothetical protein RCL1_006976 [Eukaryota sp. TZLM3-RCL]
MVYFEKQKAALCAVHTLNNLLQSQFFSEIDLAELASVITQKEHSLYLTTPSENHHVSLSGDFSTDVVQLALQNLDLSMVHLNSEDPIVVQIRSNPTSAEGFILNRNTEDIGHWLSLRKVQGKWFELDSLASQPREISPSLLELTVDQYFRQGYSVFVVYGNYPYVDPSEAVVVEGSDDDEYFEQDPNVLKAQEDADLAFALALSRSMSDK